MNNISVLVVDDNDNYRKNLLRSLRAEGFIAEGARSGEEAIDMMEKYPQKYQFAVIDHILKGGIDGIQTTKELVERNRKLFALVFTNIPTDIKEDIARFKYEAFSAGAYRYLERGSERDTPKQVKDFIMEMNQLASLRSWIQNYYAGREQVPSLLTQLNIGVDIIDRSFKVWFLNNAMHRITGLPKDELPRSPCSKWHGYNFSPCPGCLVRKTFDDCKIHFRVFLSPFLSREKEKLFFMNVWTQPIQDRQGKIVFASDGKPLAVMESVQDLTDSSQLREMSLDDRLKVIATALQERPIEGGYLGKTYFEKVEIFTRESGTNFILKAASGFHPCLKLDAPVNLYAEGYLGIAEDNMKEFGYGHFFPSAGIMDRVAYWPVMESDKTIAVLRACGVKHCNSDSIPIIRPYAAEVCFAIRDAKITTGHVSAEVESDLAELDLKLQKVASPEEALQTLVSEACILTDSQLAVLRYRDGDDAVLLRLGLKEYNAYERVAVPRYPLSKTASWSCKTIVSGQEYIVNVISNGEEIMKRRHKLKKESQRALKDSNALCFEPLLLEGKCIGALGLHSKNPECYSEENKLRIIRGISRRTALALYDYLVDQKAQKRLQDTQYETIGLVLHNINTPIGNIQYTLDMLVDYIQKNYSSNEYEIDLFNDITRQIEKITKIRKEFLNLQKDWESRIEAINVHKLIRSVVDELLKPDKKYSVKFYLEKGICDISADKAAIKVCLKVLLQNSLDELEHVTQNRQIVIRLRSATVDEFSYLTSSNLGLAIDVEDNGIGVSSDILKDLFSIIRSNKAQGFGLGLNRCRKIAQSAKGDVYYHDEYVDGAKFTLVLPYESV